MVDISGTAGKGCVVDKNWFGFDFERYGQTNKGPFIEMTAPLAATGSSSGAWSAIFEIPSYLGGSSARGPGALVVPGRYQVFAPDVRKGQGGHRLFHGDRDNVRPRHQLRGHGRDARWRGYWLAQADGGVSAYGDAHSFGSLAMCLAAWSLTRSVTALRPSAPCVLRPIAQRDNSPISPSTPANPATTTRSTARSPRPVFRTLQKPNTSPPHPPPRLSASSRPPMSSFTTTSFRPPFSTSHYPSALVQNVGKRCGIKTITQAEINTLLVSHE